MTSISQRQQWKRLIDALDAWTSAYEVSDGKIRVTRPDAEAPAHHPFLVHDTYDFHPSTTAELPPDPDEERIRPLMRERPERPVGNAVASSSRTPLPLEERGPAGWVLGPPVPTRSRPRSSALSAEPRSEQSRNLER